MGGIEGTNVERPTRVEVGQRWLSPYVGDAQDGNRTVERVEGDKVTFHTKSWEHGPAMLAASSKWRFVGPTVAAMPATGPMAMCRNCGVFIADGKSQCFECACPVTAKTHPAPAPFYGPSIAEMLRAPKTCVEPTCRLPAVTYTGRCGPHELRHEEATYNAMLLLDGPLRVQRPALFPASKPPAPFQQSHSLTCGGVFSLRDEGAVAMRAK